MNPARLFIRGYVVDYCPIFLSCQLSRHNGDGTEENEGGQQKRSWLRVLVAVWCAFWQTSAFLGGFWRPVLSWVLMMWSPSSIRALLSMTFLWLLDQNVRPSLLSQAASPRLCGPHGGCVLHMMSLRCSSHWVLILHVLQMD